MQITLASALIKYRKNNTANIRAKRFEGMPAQGKGHIKKDEKSAEDIRQTI